MKPKNLIKIITSALLVLTLSVSAFAMNNIAKENADFRLITENEYEEIKQGEIPYDAENEILIMYVPEEYDSIIVSSEAEEDFYIFKIAPIE